MGRPKGSKNKKPYPIENHKNNYWNVRVFGLDKELAAFKRMHDRVREGKAPNIAWPRDYDGFVAFCEEIGPYPSSMEKPSVGRKDHSLGYIPGNIEWQEHRLNSVLRKGTKYESDAYPTRS